MVETAGNDWGLTAEALAASMGTEADPYGGDELGAALRQMYETIGPKALQYFAETGFCLVETGTALHQLANAFAVTDQNSARTMNRAREVVESLGDL